MKRLLLLLVGLCGFWNLAAQDRIIKGDQTQIEAKVIEITQDAVRYKRFSNPDGPTYVLSTGEILYIEYPNGERDIFSQPTPKVEEQKPTESPAPQPTTFARTYALGDYYNEAGVEGVVILLPEAGRAGLILSLQEEALRWDTFPKEDARAVGATSKQEGWLNMEAVARYIEKEHLTWDHFPAFAWVRALGEGWYLPSIDEWLTISFNFNGGSRTTFNRAARNRINNTLKEHGGKKIDKMFYYYSSTEQDARIAFSTHMELDPPYVEPLKKNSGITYLVRAVHPFGGAN